MHLVHDNLNSINSLNVFHPTHNILAGGNSSGKVYVWTAWYLLTITLRRKVEKPCVWSTTIWTRSIHSTCFTQPIAYWLAGTSVLQWEGLCLDSLTAADNNPCQMWFNEVLRWYQLYAVRVERSDRQQRRIYLYCDPSDWEVLYRLCLIIGVYWQRFMEYDTVQPRLSDHFVVFESRRFQIWL